MPLFPASIAACHNIPRVQQNTVLRYITARMCLPERVHGLRKRQSRCMRWHFSGKNLWGLDTGPVGEVVLDLWQ